MKLYLLVFLTAACFLRAATNDAADTPDRQVALIRPTVLTKVESISAEYRMSQHITEAYFARNPGVDREYIDMTFDYDVMGKGKKWTYGLLQQKSDRSIMTHKRVAYNGVLYQQWDREPGLNFLTIGKSKFETIDNNLRDVDVFSLLYSFLRKENGRPSKPIFFMEHVADLSLWASRMDQGKIIGEETRIGYRCVVVEVPAGQSFDFDCAIRYRIAFATDLPGMPLHWELVDEQGNTMRAVEVTELGMLTVPLAGGDLVFPYPKKMRHVQSTYRDPTKRAGAVDVIVSREYETRKLEVNGVTDEAVFTIDPDLVRSVQEVD